MTADVLQNTGLTKIPLLKKKIKVERIIIPAKLVLPERPTFLSAEEWASHVTGQNSVRKLTTDSGLRICFKRLKHKSALNRKDYRNLLIDENDEK